MNTKVLLVILVITGFLTVKAVLFTNHHPRKTLNLTIRMVVAYRTCCFSTTLQRGTTHKYLQRRVKFYLECTTERGSHFGRVHNQIQWKDLFTPEYEQAQNPCEWKPSQHPIPVAFS